VLAKELLAFAGRGGPALEAAGLAVTGGLLHRVVRFAQALRRAGLDANPGRVADLVAALPLVDFGRRDDLYFAARATLLSRPDQREAFDQLFAAFWPDIRVPSTGQPDPSSGAPAPQDMLTDGSEGESQEGGERRMAANAPATPDESDDSGEPAQQKQAPGTSIMSYSQDEVLREKNFGDFTAEELERARRLMEEMRWKAARRLTRRSVAARAGRQLDLRRTVRRTFSTGGETLSWARRERKLKPRPLVLICDVSGSMERYTRLLLQFLHTVSHGTGATVETFVFATRLTRISGSLKRRRVEEALARVAEEVSDWSGGTRTGEALATFNRKWAARVLGRGAIAIIISDGWDRGDVLQLGREMSRLSRKATRLMWLNPLLGSPNYRPLTRGMQAALPHLDDFMPVHNLNSLAALVDRLSAVPAKRSHAIARRRDPFLPGRRS
jgi:uncharacterized protein with von Willebrand factor type A (vWA) domain